MTATMIENTEDEWMMMDLDDNGIATSKDEKSSFKGCIGWNTKQLQINAKILPTFKPLLMK